MSARGVVLVHGGFHGSWCWESVLPLLDAPSLAVDLPGPKRRDVPGVVTLADCAAAVVSDAEAAGFERFVLVGHSMGGLTITETACRWPERVERLVYVAALALPPGRSVLEHYGIDPKATQGPEMPVLEEPLAHALFAGDLSDEAYAGIHRRLVPEPMGLFEASVTSYPEAIPVTYVRCSRDQAVSDAATEEMLAALGPDDVVVLDSDHDVMLSHPEALAAVLNPLVPSP